MLCNCSFLPQISCNRYEVSYIHGGGNTPNSCLQNTLWSADLWVVLCITQCCTYNWLRLWYCNAVRDNAVCGNDDCTLHWELLNGLAVINCIMSEGDGGECRTQKILLENASAIWKLCNLELYVNLWNCWHGHPAHWCTACWNNEDRYETLLRSVNETKVMSSENLRKVKKSICGWLGD